ncbi:ArsR/SmtB family transcription factor [Elusimicrobiota bacterium]
MEDQVKVIKTLSEKNRFAVFSFLLERKKEYCVLDIAKETNLKQYNVSRYLKELKNADLVTEKRKGQFVYYKVNKAKSAYAQNLMNCLKDMKKTG